MHRSSRYINRTNTLCVFFSLFRPIVATGCDAAAPDVTQASIIAEVCNQTVVTGYSTCADQMTAYMQQSATNTCNRYSGLFTDCLRANDNTVCADSIFGYNDCHNYTMQAYAYCACYHSLPESLAKCANDQLQPQPQDVQTLPQTSTPVAAIPTNSEVPASAASADKESTPGVSTVIGGAASSSSSQSAVTFSDPRIPNTSRVRTTSLQDIIPSSDPKTAWTPDAAPSTTSEPIITFTAAAYTTNATITPTPVIISTVYTCTNDSGGGHDAILPQIPASAASASAPTTLPPIAPAPAVGPEPFAPNPAVVVVPAPGTEAGEKSEATMITKERTSGSPESPPSTSIVTQAQSPGPSIAEGSTEMTSGSAIPSPAPALNTGLVAPSVATAGRNASAMCASCRMRRRGRSKIF